MKNLEDNYLPDFDEGYGVVDDQEEAYVMHTIKDIDAIIQEIGVDIVMKGLNDYSKEQIVKWLAKKY
jgi:PP-loop superfamily ATP-utilizing enzyme